MKIVGVGPIIAATLLYSWGQPGRVRKEAAFAMLAGTAPIPASSGLTTRHCQLLPGHASRNTIGGTEPARSRLRQLKGRSST